MKSTIGSIVSSSIGGDDLEHGKAYVNVNGSVFVCIGVKGTHKIIRLYHFGGCICDLTPCKTNSNEKFTEYKGKVTLDFS